MGKNERGAESAILLRCADLILPWLNTTELASISSTCKTLNDVAKSITSRRISDASRTFENLPIPFLNSVDHHPYAFFLYTPTLTLPSHAPNPTRQPWGSERATRPDGVSVWAAAGLIADACGCHCDRCDGGCPCKEMDAPELSRECGPSCRCGSGCGNRVTQSGLSVRMKIVRDEKKGWGLYSDQLVNKGDFLCEYTGELVTTKETRKRQQLYDELAMGSRFSSALLVVREHLPSGNACMRINIDATRIGNVGRFINHSCDGGNLSTVIVRCSGALLPRLCFFASRDILEGEELSFSYGDVRREDKRLQCFCGSSSCFGVLPSELT